MRNPTTGINDQAVDRYIMHLENAKLFADSITEYLNNFGDASPEDIDWTYVGTMADVAAKLAEIAAIIEGNVE